MFDERIIALQNELKKHPDIIEACQDCRSLSEMLGMIAAKLNILLDGIYDVPDLCGMLAMKLKDRGTIEILSPYNTVPVEVKVGENTVSIDLPEPLQLPKKEG